MDFFDNLAATCTSISSSPSRSGSLVPSPARARLNSVSSNSPERRRSIESCRATLSSTNEVHILPSPLELESSGDESSNGSERSIPRAPSLLASSPLSQVAVIRRAAEKSFAKKVKRMSRHNHSDLYGGSLTADYLLRDIKHRRRATSKSFRHFRKVSSEGRLSRTNSGSRSYTKKHSVEFEVDDDPSDDDDNGGYQEPQVVATHLARCESLSAHLHDELVDFWLQKLPKSSVSMEKEPLIERWRRKASEIWQSRFESDCLNTEIEVMVMRDQIKEKVTCEWTDEEVEAQRRMDRDSTFWRLYHIDDRKLRAPTKKKGPLSPKVKDNSRVEEMMVQTKSNFWKKARNSELPDARLIPDIGERLQNEPGDVNESKGLLLGRGKQSATRRLVQHRSCVHHRRGKETLINVSSHTLSSVQSLPILPVATEAIDEDEDEWDYHNSFVDRGGFMDPSSRQLQKRIIRKGMGVNHLTPKNRDREKLPVLVPQASLPNLPVVPARDQPPRNRALTKSSRVFRAERLPPVVSFPAAFDKTPLHAPRETNSESGQDEAAESATMKYIRVCRAAGVVPTPFVLEMANTFKITNTTKALVDDDLRALASMVRALDRLELVDLSSNTMLADRAFEPFLKKLFGRPAANTLKRLNLEGCKGAGKAAVEILISLVREGDGLAVLEYFNIGGITIPTPSQLDLCKAIASHPRLRSVLLASTGLGYAGFAKDCLKTLMTSDRLEELDLSWNCFDWDVFEAFGKDVVTHKGLTHLNLASCSTSAMQNGDAPIAWFLEALAHDQHLKMLDISFNCIDFKGALVLEDALANHKNLTEINISNNPLGVGGMRSFLRLLSRESSGLRRFNCTSCMGQGESLGDVDNDAKEKIFNATDPSGRYALDLSRPYFRAVLRMLYRTCERFHLAPNHAFGEMTYTKSNSVVTKAPVQTKTNNSAKSGRPMGTMTYKHPNEKNGFGTWDIPCAGILMVTFSIAEAISRIFDEDGLAADIADKKVVISWVHRDAIVRDESLKPAAAQYIERYLTLVKFTPSFAKVAPLLALWHSLRQKPDEWKLLLSALSRDFLLKFSHIHQLCRAPHCMIAVLSNLLHCIIGGPVQLFQALTLPTNLHEYLEVHNNNKHLLLFNIENCTGSYSLDLGNASEYAVAEAIFLVDQWEAVTARKKGFADRSKFGNWSNVRNCMYHNFEIRSVSDWHIPLFDEVRFDFVSWRRPPLEAMPLTDAKCDQILRILFASHCTQDSKLKSLRMISDQLFLRCTQLRNLVNVFPTDVSRVDVLVMFFTRLKDTQNMKMIRSRLAHHPEEWAMLSERIGKIALFPYFQPEQFEFSFQLGRHEDRLCASLIIYLAFREHGNVCEPSLRQTDGSNFAFPVGLPPSWDKIENIPREGELTFTYMCSADQRAMKIRRDLSRKYGGHNMDDTVIQDVVWWAVLSECPAAVLTFLYYCMQHFPDAYAAFKKIDGVDGNGQVTLVEMKEAVQKMGWVKFKKNPDLIKQVFRYLDPDGGGEISLEEWDVMQELFKELQLTMLEFLQFINRTFGDFDLAWQKMDTDGSDSIDHDEWDEAVKSIGFFGQSETIFQYLANANIAPQSRRASDNSITRQGWKKLEEVWENRHELHAKIMQAN